MASMVCCGCRSPSDGAVVYIYIYIYMYVYIVDFIHTSRAETLAHVLHGHVLNIPSMLAPPVFMTAGWSP